MEKFGNLLISILIGVFAVSFLSASEPNFSYYSHLHVRIEFRSSRLEGDMAVFDVCDNFIAFFHLKRF